MKKNVRKNEYNIGKAQNKTKRAVLFLLFPATLCGVLLTGCQSDNFVAKTPAPTTQEAEPNASIENVEGIAATLNDGHTISEQDIACYIEQYRLYNDVTDDVKWATFLDESGQTIDGIRKEAAEKLALDYAVQKEAEKNNITVNDEEIDKQIELIKRTASSENAINWIDTLRTAGYENEDAYRADIKTKLLKDKLATENSTPVTPSDTQMLTYANKNVAKYTGKKIVEIEFQANSVTAANSAFDVANGSSSEEEFRKAGEELVDNGIATKIEDTGWTCLRTDYASVTSAVADSKVGDVVMYDCIDNTKRIAFILEDYHATNKGAIVLNDMPDEIKNKLRTDTAIAVLDDQRKSYLAGLLEKTELKMNDMPENLPYYVDLSISEYGEQTTSEQDEQEMKNLVNEQIEELDAAGSEQSNAS